MVQDEAERRAFFERLTSLARQEGEPLYVLLTLRAEFLGDAAGYPELRWLLQAHQELVAKMDAGELRSAMEQQARAVGLRFEADLANTLLDDVVGEPGAMPLLQHALLELWKRRHGRWLRAEEYRAIGGVKQAIAHTADALYAGLDATDQTRAQRLFLRLVRVDEGPDQRDTRRRVALDDLARNEADRAATVALVKRLADARLVVTSVNPLDGRAEVELAHESIIEHWERFQRWISQDRQGLLTFQQIVSNADEWRNRGKDSSYLFQGQRLRRARQWARPNQNSLSYVELAFLQQSWRQAILRRIVSVSAILLASIALVGVLFAIVNEQGWFSRHLARSTIPEFINLPVSELLWYDSNTILVGIGERSLKESDIALSQDGGQTWTWTSLPGTHVAALAQVAQEQGPLYALVIGAGLFRSDDANAHWDLIASTLPITTYGALAVSPKGVLYLGDYIEGLGIFSSVDGGYHWERVDGSPGVAVFDLAWLKDHLVVSSADGLWLWSPDGIWRKWPKDGSAPILSAASLGESILAGGGAGIVEIGLDAQGGPLSNQIVSEVSVGRHSGSNDRPQAIAGSYDGHLLYTSAQGDWRLDGDTVLPFIYAIRPDPTDPGTFWVATQKGLEKVVVSPWYRRIDSGASQ